MMLHEYAAGMLLGFGIEALIGWPDALFRQIGHPVTWCGALINWAERRLNQGTPRQRRFAVVAVALWVVFVVAGLAGSVQAVLPSGWLSVLLTGVLAWPLVAARSLYSHVARVAAPLAQGDLIAARHAVAMIVGRDTAVLDASGVARAALESLAENSSDGVLAPLFWGALFGLPGIAGYKAINTLDSMIGHRSPRYLAFGWASARIDDAVNYIPARLTALLFALVARRRVQALQTVFRDARRHRSPNGGWPEAAMAGALGVRLSGPRLYGETIAPEPWINAAGRDAEAADIWAGLKLYRRGLLLAGLALGLAAL